MTHVAVCALTFRRPRGLASLLDGLAKLDVPEGVDVRVVIVDNDPDGSGVPVVEAARRSLPWTLTCVVESEPGIPFARNRALREAAGADFVAFIDDDEIPDPAWLAELLRVQRETNGEIVTGPVLPRFDETPPGWIVDGRFFDRPRYRTGEELSWATTSSVLIDTRLVARGAAFDERMRHTGGSDTHFFMRAHLQGHRIVWSDEAVVYETIHASRITTRWILQRQFRRGNTLSLCLRMLQDTPIRRARRVCLGVARIAQGMVLAVVGVPRGRAGVVSGLQRVWFGVGLLAGLFGVEYEEYRVHHGA